MKKFIATFCILGTALVLSACETSTTYNSSASYASGRTAGMTDGSQKVMTKKKATRSERVFRRIQSK